MPFFSVIIPLYNKEAFVEATINSVLNQTFQDFEVIVVDDGSTDEGLKLAKAIKNSKITILEQKNQGPSVARNKAIAYANGKYIAPMDADDFWYSNHLFELKNLINSFPVAGLFCNNYEIKLNNNLTKPANFNFKFYEEHLIIPDFFNANIYNYIPSSSSTAFLKSVFTALGTYNTSLRTGQDIDLWIRFALKYDVAFNPNITMRYNHFDDSSLSKSNYNLDRYHLISSYWKEELKNPSLKKYLDINRYAVTLRCKITNEKELYTKLQKEINYNNLNIKQRLLIKMPKIVLVYSKKLQEFLKMRKIHITAFS